MFLAKVVGNVVSTHKDPKLQGMKLLIVQPFDPKKQTKQTSLVAVDTVGAGIGELILYVTGTAGRIGAKKMDAPIDAAIVAIVDELDVREDIEDQ